MLTSKNPFLVSPFMFANKNHTWSSPVPSALMRFSLRAAPVHDVQRRDERVNKHNREFGHLKD